jgi:hypothetical protein
MPCRRLDTATFKCSIIRRKIGFSPGAMTVVIAVSSAARATAESTTSSRSVILVVRHVAAAVSKAGKVNAGPAACDSKCSPGTEAVTSPQMAAQIKHAVSVHQGSLIL